MTLEQKPWQRLVAVLGGAGIIVAIVLAHWAPWVPRSALPPSATTPPGVTTTAPATPLPSAPLPPRVIPIPRVTIIPPATHSPHVTVIARSSITPRVIPTPPAAPMSRALKSCDELKAEIQAKLDANSLTGYVLTIMAHGDLAGQQVIGSCEGNTKKIVLNRTRNAQ